MILTEGDSFLVEVRKTFTVPDNATAASFVFTDQSFDTRDRDSVNDAFEAALVDSQGRPLVATIGTGRDAFFNLTEELSPATGLTTDFDGVLWSAYQDHAAGGRTHCPSVFSKGVRMLAAASGPTDEA